MPLRKSVWDTWVNLRFLFMPEVPGMKSRHVIERFQKRKQYIFPKANLSSACSSCRCNTYEGLSNCTLLDALSKRQYVCLFPPLINPHLLNQIISHYNPELHWNQWRAIHLHWLGSPYSTHREGVCWISTR